MNNDIDLLEELEQLEKEKLIIQAPNDFISFSKLIYPNNQLTHFHLTYYQVLDHFVKGNIKKLMITIPPQSGKSTASSMLLPALMLGINPNLQIAIGSYQETFAYKFSREIDRIIDSEDYAEAFPETTLHGSERCGHKGRYLRTLEKFEIPGYSGFLKVVGRGGALTGEKVDIMIMDDLYKNMMEGNSPVIRENVWDWYNSVVTTRFHNDSQQLIVFTRWHEEDLIGRLEGVDNVHTIESLMEIPFISNDDWIKINFEAVKESDKTELDPREKGEALWAEKHSLKDLENQRQRDAISFQCMYQGDPTPKEGLLYSEFKTYAKIDRDEIVKIGNYTDTADQGDDYLCSICYCIDYLNNIYITDVVYTQESMELTEPYVAKMLKIQDTRTAYIESNNGGRGFARNVENLLTDMNGICSVEWFHQSNNKESRILTNASTVNKYVYFPENWAKLWPDLYNNITRYKRIFKANKHDDVADCLTGIIEKEITEVSVTSRIYG